MRFQASRVIRNWRHLSVTSAFALLVGCGGSDDPTEPPAVILAGDLAGRWALTSGPLTAPGSAQTCTITATLRLYRDASAALPAGVYGTYSDAVVSCAGIVESMLGGYVTQFSSAAAVTFSLATYSRPQGAPQPSPFGAVVQGSLSGSGITGQFSMTRPFAGVSQWNGTFTATRVSTNPDGF